MKKIITLRDFEIFWDNGKYVAVTSGPDGVRRNFAPENCKTKKQAIAAAQLEICEWNNVEPTRAMLNAAGY